MEKIYFSGPSHVQIQGDQVLRFISLENEFASYQLIGFEENPVTIVDYRSFGINAIKTLIFDERLYDFAPKFNKPSYVTIVESINGELLIKLQETAELNPPFMLWIAIGMEEDPPNYSYLFREIVPYHQNKLAVLSLYKRPFRKSPITLPVSSLQRNLTHQILETSFLK